MNREEILRSTDTAKLIAEFIRFAHDQQLPHTTSVWKQFAEHKLNEGKFKTEDGVVVGNEEVVYGVDQKDYSTLNKRTNLVPLMIHEYLWFSSEYARQSWIEQNKPVLSYQDVSTLLVNHLASCGDTEYLTNFSNKFRELLSDLVKSKMK